MSKQALIDKILSDGENEVNRIIAEARQKADAKISSAKESVERELSQREEKALSFLPEQERRICSVAQLERKKTILSAKQEVMENTLNEAIKRLYTLSDEEYLAIIRSMLNSAEDGDIVVISERDKERITESFIKEVADSLGITLTLSKDYRSFQGGILLLSDGYDKDMTLEGELALIKEEEEAKIAQILFS